MLVASRTTTNQIHSKSSKPAILMRTATIFLAALSIVILALESTPVPIHTWLSRPRDAFWLAQGLNPHPMKLFHPLDRPLSAMAQLGRKLFFDPSLSGSGEISCASCHSPAHAYGPPGKNSVMFGGPSDQTAGFRAVPSLRYLYRQPPFSIGPDPQGDNDKVVSLARQAQRAKGHAPIKKSALLPLASASNLVPQGGLFWDGRVDTLQQQAMGPLFNPAEMDAGTPAEVDAKLVRADYAADFRKLFGNNIFQDPHFAVAEAMFAIARFQIEDPSFHPFTSKYDAWLAGKARFNRAELRGYLAFNDPNKGNCAACHLDKPTRDGLPPLFTDFQYEALGVPRNPNIPANQNPHYYDLGICGPFRTDMAQQAQYCGMFLTPSLRNVAVRQVFFHNGVFHSLKKVLDWYANRDLRPALFYSLDAAGTVVKYDDMPARYRRNVDIVDAPFNRHPGGAPALNKREIRDVIAFLNTLTDADVNHKQ